MSTPAYKKKYIFSIVSKKKKQVIIIKLQLSSFLFCFTLPDESSLLSCSNPYTFMDARKETTFTLRLNQEIENNSNVLE